MQAATEAIQLNPFVGPRPFQNIPQDIARFFGRNRETRDILSLVIAQRTLLLYGKSGTGKSSLLNAAIIPELVNRGFDVLLPPARVQGVVPQDVPADTIANIYIFNAITGWLSGEDPSRHARTTLAKFLAQRRPVLTEDGDPVLRVLIFDQLEELFTAYPRRWQERQQFFEQVSAALEADSLLRVIFVLREDHLAEMNRYAPALPGGLRTTYRLESLRRGQAVLAVARPLDQTPRRFAEGAADYLVDELLTIQDAGAGLVTSREEFVEPVVLQVICQSLWQTLPHDMTTISTEAVQQYAHVGDALLRFYDECVTLAAEQSATPAPQIRDWFEKQLITPARTRGMVYQGSQDTGGLPNTAIRVLENQHIIRGEERANALWYELAHDRFIEPILESNRRNDPELLRQQRLLERQRTATSAVRLGQLGIVLVILLVGVLIFIASQYSGIVSRYQPQIDALANYQPEFQIVRVLDVNGSEIAQLTSGQGGARTDVPLANISPFMIHAVVSQENERFFEDPGWDWLTIFRALVENLASSTFESGANTITQQVARQLVLQDSTVSSQSNLEEIIIASQIAQQYSKNDILQLYLNEIYFSNQTYGVEAASQFYFDRSARDLNLPESALLTALIAAPATYDPVRDGGEDLATYSARREATFKRMDEVIDQMVQVGCLQFQHAPYLNEPFCITDAVVRQAAVQQAAVEANTYLPRDVTFKYPHFVQLVQQTVEREFGPGEIYRRGFVIRTTLNPAIQDAAEAALHEQIAVLATTGVNTGSVMVSDPRNGAIRAMVGSPDFNNEDIDGQINSALTWQQPGTAILPVVYTAALEGSADPNTDQLRYLTPATILWDVPTTFPTNPPYTPVNFDGRFRGPIALRYALQNSVHVPAVKAYDFIGAAKFQDVAGRLGLRFLENAQFGLAAALGAVEVTLYDMMAAYGTLANDGTRTPLYAIESITDSNGNVVPVQRPAPAQVVQPQLAFLMQNILSDDAARADQFGQGGPLTIAGLPTTSYVAAKTGTTNQNRDLWSIGFTSNAVVGVWLGRPDNAPTFIQGSGHAVAASLWNSVMTATLRTMPAPQQFISPGDVVQMVICATTGTQPASDCPTLRNELFAINQLPPLPEQAFVRQVALDTWTGLQANQFCPDNQVVGTFASLDDPAAVAWLNSPSGQPYLQSLGFQGSLIEAIPAAACDLNTEVPIARITFPADGQSISGIVPVTGSASSTRFNRYQLEVAPADSKNFTIVSGPTTTPQTFGILGTLDTRGFPNGAYTLRLAMFNSSGGWLYRTLTLNIANADSALPTGTPTQRATITATPTPTVPIELTQTQMVAELVATVTEIAAARLTEQAQPTSTPTPTQPVFIVATPIPLDPASLTATAMVFGATPGPAEIDDIFLSATAIISRATATAAYQFTATASSGTVLPVAGCVHVLQPGDGSLFNLSLLYGVSVQELASANGIANINLIYVGQRIIIPGCGTTGVIPPGTSALKPRRAVLPGDNAGQIEPGGQETWFYNAEAGETISLEVVAERPANGTKFDTAPQGFDPVVIITAPDGTVLTIADDTIRGRLTDVRIQILRLPEAGTYLIEVSSYQGRTGGAYTLRVDSSRPAETPVPP